jgi:hypothetical protein
MNSVSNSLQFDVIKKYEEKVKNIMLDLCEITPDNSEKMDEIKKKIESEVIELEKIINEECINRTVLSNKINTALIAKLRESDYDFNQDKSQHYYENIINTTINSMNNFNLN